MEEGGPYGPEPVALADRMALEDAIRRLPPGSLRPSDFRVPEFELFSDWDIDCHYAPFDHVEGGARLVVVGISPSLAQSAAAFAAARDTLWAGGGWAEAQRAARAASFFAGPALTNLVRMLDGLGLARWLAAAGVCRVAGARELFDASRGEVQVTNCVRYPVAVNGRDYTGRRPLLMRDPRLRDFVLDGLGAELAQLPQALVLPLGRIAGEGVAALVERGRLEPERCLLGLPHPSGANGHREADFDRGGAELRGRLRAWFAAQLVAEAPQPASLESP